MLTLDIADLALLEPLRLHRAAILMAVGKGRPAIAALHPDRGLVAAVAAILESERLALGVAAAVLALEAVLLECLTAAAVALHAERLSAAAAAALHAEGFAASATAAAGLDVTAAVASATATLGLGLGRLLIAAPMTAAGLRARRHRDRQRGDTRGKE
ncbi:MAG TPA: hypothetical protein VIZ66_05800 [Sphingomicrobium sp.]